MEVVAVRIMQDVTLMLDRKFVFVHQDSPENTVRLKSMNVYLRHVSTVEFAQMVLITIHVTAQIYFILVRTVQ